MPVCIVRNLFFFKEPLMLKVVLESKLFVLTATDDSYHYCGQSSGHSNSTNTIINPNGEQVHGNPLRPY